MNVKTGTNESFQENIAPLWIISIVCSRNQVILWKFAVLCEIKTNQIGSMKDRELDMYASFPMLVSSY